MSDVTIFKYCLASLTDDQNLLGCFWWVVPTLFGVICSICNVIYWSFQFKGKDTYNQGDVDIVQVEWAELVDVCIKAQDVE